MSAAQTIIQSMPLTAATAYWKEQIRSARALALFLNFDGVLLSGTGRTDAAMLDLHTKSLIEKLHRLGGIQIAILSGRPINDVRSRCGAEGIIYAGNNGLEIETETVCFREPHADHLRLQFRRLALRLQQLLSDASGVRIETKSLGLSIHYGDVHESLQDWVRGLVREAVCPLPQFTCVDEGQSIEVRPAAKWNNGNAVRWLLEYHAPAGAYAIYIGSDATDEDAFHGLNPDGLTIRVGMHTGTLARFYVPDMSGVRSFLGKICELRSQEKH